MAGIIAPNASLIFVEIAVKLVVLRVKLMILFVGSQDSFGVLSPVSVTEPSTSSPSSLTRRASRYPDSFWSVTLCFSSPVLPLVNSLEVLTSI